MPISTKTVFQRYQHLASFCVLLGIALAFHADWWNAPLRGTHLWAQSDRLALANGFYDHGMNFFLPRTHCTYPKENIVGVEFPIQSYLTAIIAKIFHAPEKMVGIFRGVTLFFVLSGAFSLYLLAFSWTKRWTISLLPAVFLLSSPIIMFYGGTTLPDPASLGMLCVAWYFLYKHGIQETTQTATYLALLFATFATLIKLSSAIGLVAIIGIQGLRILSGKKWQELLPYGVAAIGCIAIIALQVVYMRYVNISYNSGIFIAKARPLEGDTFLHYFGYIFERHKRNYVTVPYFLVAIVGFFGVAVAVAQKLRTHWLWAAHIAAVLMLQCAGFYAMALQFEVHDYYAICILLPLFTLTTTFAIILWGNFLDNRPAQSPLLRFADASVGLLLLALIGTLIPQMQRKKHEEDPNLGWFFNANLSRNTLPTGSRVCILSAGGEAPNVGFAQLACDGLPRKNDDFVKSLKDTRDFMNWAELDYLIGEKSVMQSAMRLPQTDSLFNVYRTGETYLIFKKK